AKIAARLRQGEQLSKTEAERLVSFTNNSSPLFIFGAVSIGFFQNARLGLLLAVCHYLSNMIVGIIMRFHGRQSDKPAKKTEKKKEESYFLQALYSMHKTRTKDKRPLGEILGDVVIESIKKLIMVGGMIIHFFLLFILLHIFHNSCFIV